MIFIPSLYFNNTQYNDNQRYLGLFLEEKLSLLEHIDIKTKKVRIGVKLIRKLKSFITKFVLAGNLQEFYQISSGLRRCCLQSIGSVLFNQ